MIQMLNQKMRWVLVFVLAVIAVSFIFFTDYNTGFGRSPKNPGTIAGKTITFDALRSDMRDTSLIYLLRTLQMLPPGEQAGEFLYLETWRRLVVAAAAQEAGIQIPEESVQHFLLNHPLFQENGKFSAKRYEFVKTNILDPQGVSEVRFIELIRSLLAHDTMLEQIRSATLVQPQEVDEALDLYLGKAKASYIVLEQAAVAKTLQPTEDELKAFYETSKAAYATPEKRSFEYVLFQLAPAEQKLPDAEKEKPLRDLGQKAYEFSEPFYQAQTNGKAAPDFAKTASEKGLQLRTTGLLESSQALPGTPDGLKLAEAGFTLTPANPVSDYIQLQDGYAILHLKETQVSQETSFEQAAAKVRELYLRFKASEELANQAKALVQALRSDLQSGMAWEAAVAKNNAKATSTPVFSLTSQPDILKTPHAQVIMSRASQLQPGSVSDPAFPEGAAVIVYLAERQPAAAAEKESQMAEVLGQLQRRREQQTLDAWLKARYTAKGTHLPDEVYTRLALR
jgi:peptidyl-prolyl cis-trans isomerase D